MKLTTSVTTSEQHDRSGKTYWLAEQRNPDGSVCLTEAPTRHEAMSLAYLTQLERRQRHLHRSMGFAERPIKLMTPRHQQTA
ncbi:MAG TPA: hypothetical protein DCZ12_12125 [Gammaproteobacteria bacterium]|nr:hypothetical protein [Gammaproteobacteria bacterium]